mmetsp:Transcript_40027/g.54501  ORF Transcript_40027/g.54501 Transcript_40027/m.54501 type:complete len:272 (+) Transcript_40027:355-1170(+)
MHCLERWRASSCSVAIVPRTTAFTFATRASSAAATSARAVFFDAEISRMRSRWASIWISMSTFCFRSTSASNLVISSIVSARFTRIVSRYSGSSPATGANRSVLPIFFAASILDSLKAWYFSLEALSISSIADSSVSLALVTSPMLSARKAFRDVVVSVISPSAVALMRPDFSWPTAVASSTMDLHSIPRAVSVSVSLWMWLLMVTTLLEWNCPMSWSHFTQSTRTSSMRASPNTRSSPTASRLSPHSNSIPCAPLVMARRSSPNDRRLSR